MLAGCASENNPFASSAEQAYVYDAVPSPLPDLTPAEVDRINAVPASSFTVWSSSTLSQNVIRQSEP